MKEQKRTKNENDASQEDTHDSQDGAGVEYTPVSYLSFKLDADMAAALGLFIAQHELQPAASTVVRAALREYLTKRGTYPLPRSA